MKDFIKILIIFFVIDGLWLKFYMGKKYDIMVPVIQKSPMVTKLWTAVLAYLLLGIGVRYLVMPNIKKETKYKDALFYGGIFGLVVYGVYDFTAASVFKNWDIQLAIIDILWGTFVSALVPLIVVYLNDTGIKTK